jgi:hypothetical protein
MGFQRATTILREQRAKEFEIEERGVIEVACPQICLTFILLSVAASLLYWCACTPPCSCSHILWVWVRVRVRVRACACVRVRVRVRACGILIAA